MKYFILLAAIAVSFSAYAEEKSALMTVATEEDIGVMVMGDNIAYTKKFDLLIVNADDTPVDLSTGCWRLYDAEGSVYELDTVAEEVSSGMLQAGRPQKGFAIFAGEDAGIHDAKLVRFLPSCTG